MLRRPLALALVLAALSMLPGRAAAQVVETPIAFDSAGRVMSITPGAAARARLGPPAWRVTGDFAEARLFALGGGEYVLVVTRASGAVERYPLTGADVAYLRAHTTGLPASLVRGVDRGVRTRFVVSQSLLGAAVYAPAFAYAVSNDAAGRTASGLLVAGLTYFGAATLSREIPISVAQNRLATHAGLHGGAAGLGAGYALDLPNDGRAALTFVGGLAGTAAGLFFGRTMTPDEATASAFGADVAALTALGLGSAVSDDERSIVGAMVGAGLAGYPLGLLYARSVPHHVVEGDVAALAVSAGVGALAAVPFIVDADDDAKAAALTAGGLLGLAAGDYFLVGRYDHTPGEGALVALGAGAGALMGAGVATLIDRDEAENDRLVASLAAVGGVAGIAVAEGILRPSPDARRFAAGLRFEPLGLALAAAGMRGRHTVLRWTF